MANVSVEWITLHVEEGEHLSVDGEELRTAEAAAAFEVRAERWKEVAIHGVEVQRPEDVGRIRTIGRKIQWLNLRMDHPYWKRFLAPSTTRGSTSAECEENNPLSCHIARVESLEEIASDWRANPPEAPVAAARRKRRVHDKKLEVRGKDWWREHSDWKRNHPSGDGRDIIEVIAAREDYSFAHVEREIRRARRGK